MFAYPVIDLISGVSHLGLRRSHSGAGSLLLHNMTYFRLQSHVVWPFPAVAEEEIHSLTEPKVRRGAGLP